MAEKSEIIEEYANVQLQYFKENAGSKGLLYTQGLSRINQHDLAGKSEQIYPFIELYFLLPSHWDLSSENQKWPISVLKRMIDGQQQKQAWFGPGDTLPAHVRSKEFLPINSIFKQTHFVLVEPIKAEPLLKAVLGEVEYNWLGLVPIFREEFIYKNSRSAVELMMKFEKKQVSEELDERRPVAAKKKLFGLF